jgi:hypothetical protein
MNRIDRIRTCHLSRLILFIHARLVSEALSHAPTATTDAPEGAAPFLSRTVRSIMG